MTYWLVNKFARVLEDDEKVATPRLAEYLQHFHAASVGITSETTEEMFNKIVTETAKTWPIVTIIPRSKLTTPNNAK